jgi:serine/threonine-protein kinase
VLELVKAGGMGAVYRARDRRLNKEVALKQLLGGPDAWAEERFSAEGEWLSRLRHPALPRVTDSFCHDGCRFLVMDLVPGQDLESRVEGQGPLPPERVRDIALQVLEVLDFLHRQDPPVLYRDLKPANLILGEDGRVTLVDFGLARTSSGAPVTAVGTEGYAPLEQYQGRAEVRSDLYALGATMFHLLTGRRPAPFSYEAPGPQVPPWLERVLRRAMAPDPEGRFSSAAEMRAALLVPGGASRRAADGAEMVRVPAGEFRLGATVCPEDLAPALVWLDEFWIDRTPVTQAQFRAFVEATGYLPRGDWQDWARPGTEEHPAVGVTWEDARAYCRWADKELPTEEQWEKAARGTDGRSYPWGEEWDPRRCHHGQSRPAGMAAFRDGRGTCPVGLYPAGASPWGCLDMAGNVWEWTASAGPEDTRVLRGGCWANRDPAALRCSSRLWAPPGQAGPLWGFRGLRRRAP